MRYLIDGCYGDGNVGDECLLQAVARLVRSADPAAQIAAFSSAAERTEAETGLTAVPQCNPFSRNLYGSVVKGLLWRTVRQIRRCDVFILGGGELFRDDVGPSATLGMFYRMRLARLLGKRVLALGVGAQPATTWWGRRIIRRALRDAEAVVFRDSDSLRVALELVPGLATASCLPDLVFSLDWQPYRADRREAYETDTPLRIGVAVKSLPKSHRCHEAVNLRLPGVLAEALSAYGRQRRCRVSVLPFADADVSVAERVAEQLRGAGVAVEEMTPPQIEPLQRRMAELDCLLAVPLHASVFAFACGVPALGLAYDDKIARLYDAFRVREQCLHVATADAGSLERGLGRIVQQRGELGSHLVAKARQAEQTIRATVTGLLLKRPTKPFDAGQPFGAGL